MEWMKFLKTHYRETIVDDEISAIFSCIHESSYVVFISDTCSSGTILDLQFTDKNCVAISGLSRLFTNWRWLCHVILFDGAIKTKY